MKPCQTSTVGFKKTNHWLSRYKNYLLQDQNRNVTVGHYLIFDRQVSLGT